LRDDPDAPRAQTGKDVNNSNHSADDDLAELRQAVLDDWIIVTTRTSAVLEDITNTVSWRVTKPLRIVRRFQASANELGLVAATDLAAASVARRLGRG
jgi:hypothetical protein